jgi:hypothetical protein
LHAQLKRQQWKSSPGLESRHRVLHHYPAKDEEEMAKSAKPRAAQLEIAVDLRALAKACGYALDDQEYNARLRSGHKASSRTAQSLGDI